MKLYIIGNGFDIAHGLPTQYWDFRTYLEHVAYDFLQAFEEHYYIYPNMSDDAKKKLLWNELETNLANIDEDIIIENATSIEMDLESGDIGIEDTLYDYFTKEYQYINKLAVYLKRWIRTIKIRDTLPKVSQINKDNRDLYINFNYTATLEKVYGISDSSVIHIHGSLRDYTDDPVLGHGNLARIEAIGQKQKSAEEVFDEKEISICKVVKDYYRTTLKDINRYMYNLQRIANEDITEIIVAGHSLAGIDMPYFGNIDLLCGRNVVWTLIWFDSSKKSAMRQSLIDAGIDENRIQLKPASEFYDLQDEEAAKRKAFEIRHGF